MRLLCVIFMDLIFKEIDYVLKSMPDNLRHRYTPENTLEILRIAGYE